MTTQRRTISVQGSHPQSRRDHGTITVIRTARPNHDFDDIIHTTYTYDHDEYWRHYHRISAAHFNTRGYAEHFTTTRFIITRTRGRA